MAISLTVLKIVSIIWSKVTVICTSGTKTKKQIGRNLCSTLDYFRLKLMEKGRPKLGGLIKSSVPWIILK